MPNSNELFRLKSAPLDEVLFKLYPATFLRWLYVNGLTGLLSQRPDLLPAGHQGGPTKPPNKPLLLPLLRTVLRDKTLAAAMVAALPAKTREALNALTWVSQAPLLKVEALIGDEIARVNPDQQRQYYEPMLLHEPHGLLCVYRRGEDAWGYMGSRTAPDKANFTVCLPDVIRRVFRAFIPPPPEFALIPLDAAPSGRLRYVTEATAGGDAALAAEFIAQGHLKFTKGEQVAVVSLRRLQALMAGPEFFPEHADRDLALLRARLLVMALSFAGEPARESLLTGTDRAVALRELFKTIAAHSVFLSETLLPEFRASEHHAGRLIPRTTVLVDFFAKLPAGRWVSYANMQSYFTLREQVPSVFAVMPRDAYDGNRFNFNVDAEDADDEDVDDIGYGGGAAGYGRVVTNFELIGDPLLKGFAFLLAALGFAEIAYDTPTAERYRTRRRAYLTPFDGLRAVRLTPLGEYVLGLRKSIDMASVEPARAVIELDDVRLLATCHRVDALTALALGQFMEKVTDVHYRMTHKSLLGGCSTRPDLEARIRLFRRVVCEQPPPIWERFMAKALASIAPIQAEPEWLVLKLAEDEELRHHLATDPELRGMTLKVEGLRIAVRRNDLRKLTRRLERFGYLTPLTEA